MSVKSLYVEYELLGCEPPRDVAGQLIQAGDWIVYGQSVGSSGCHLRFGRAFPMEAARVAKEAKRLSHNTNRQRVPVTVYYVGRGETVGRGTLTSYGVNACIVPESVVPDFARAKLAGATLDEIQDRAKVAMDEDKRKRAERVAEYRAKQHAAKEA